MTTHTVATGQFEGPLDILLELVERKKLEVTSISVAEITADYLIHLKTLAKYSPEELSEFARLGARLLYIKSLALLPQESQAEQAEELQQLNLELDEYRHMQAAARQLGERVKNRTWQRQAITQLPPNSTPLPELTLNQLAEAFSQALKRAEPEKEGRIIRHHISVEETLIKLRKKLATGFELQEMLDVCRDRLEIIVTFLALLELIREGSAHVGQSDQFAPIRVEGIHG